MSEKENTEKRLLRWPGTLRRSISAVAKNAKRSVNQEIVLRLEASLKGDDDLTNGNSEDIELLTWFRSLNEEERAAVLTLIAGGEKR